MKTTLIFIMAITIIFNSYADDLHLIKDRLPTENKKLKTNNKYKDDGTYIIIDENNIKNSTASITKYKGYSKLNRLLSDSTNKNKPVININPVDNKGVSHIVFNKMDIGKKGIYFNNNIENSAKLIIAEIDSNEKTRLFGELAILGTKAAILVANQQGISCISCSFSGTDRVTLLAGKINLGLYEKIDNIKLNQSMNKSISFSGNINFNNIKDIEVLAYNNNIINANTQIKAHRITYRTGNMPFFIEYNNINDKNAHINLSYFKPWLVDDFGYSKFQIKQGSQLSANEMNVYVTGGSFRNAAEININSLFYFNVYKVRDIREVINRITKNYQFNNQIKSEYQILKQARKNYLIVNRGKIITGDFVNGNAFTSEMISKGNGTVKIKQ